MESSGSDSESDQQDMNTQQYESSDSSSNGNSREDEQNPSMFIAEPIQYQESSDQEMEMVMSVSTLSVSDALPASARNSSFSTLEASDAMPSSADELFENEQRFRPLNASIRPHQHHLHASSSAEHNVSDSVSLSTLQASDIMPGSSHSPSISTLSVSDALPEFDGDRSRSESESDSTRRIDQLRASQVEARQRETREREANRLSGAERIRLFRDRMSADEQQASRQQDRDHHREQRASQDAGERAARNLRESQARRRRNAAIGLDLNGIGFEYDPAIDYREHHLLQTGRMDTMCSYCHALRYISEPPGMCCVSGKVSVAAFEPPDDIAIQELFFGDYPEARAFITNIRKYNGVFQMTSFGANIIRPDGYNPTFKIQGQVYHRIGPLLPSPGELPTYLQIYFMGDAAMQIERRTGLYEGMRPNIVGIFQALLDRSNRLIEIFRTNIDRLPSENHQIVIRADRRPAGEHERRFNAPLNDEVAILFVEGQQPHRDVAVRRRSGGLMRINELHPSYDALQYPLILWRGNDTYHPNIAQINPATGEPTQKRVSPSD